MIKQEISFEDYNGDKQTRTCYFGFNRRELIQMNASMPGGLEGTIKQIGEQSDFQKVVILIKNLILDAYGEKSADGLVFMKTPAIREAFECSPMFDELYMEMMNDAEKFAAFVNGTIPANLRGQLDKLEAVN